MKKKKIKSLFCVSNKYCQQLSLELISRLVSQLLYNCIYGSNVNMRLKNKICLKNQRDVLERGRRRKFQQLCENKLEVYIIFEMTKIEMFQKTELHPVHKLWQKLN